MDPSLLPYPAKHRLTDTQQPVGQMLPQGLGMAGSWIPVVDQGLVNAQLQYQLAPHNPQNFQVQLSNGNGALQRARMSGVDIASQARLTAAEAQLPQATWPSVPNSSLPPPAPGPQYSGNWISPVGLEENTGLRAFTNCSVPFLPVKASEIDIQTLAMDRMRREVSRLQVELDRAEREVLRQKGLRESERLEFTEAKDRLKQSWANDREDFARVKTMLRMKNADHHTQSARLSQQLKDSEACNRGLREIAIRHGFNVPPELEGSQTRRFSCIPKPGSFVEGAPTFRGSPEVYGEGRGSLDSYFQTVGRQAAHEPNMSLPARVRSHQTLNLDWEPNSEALSGSSPSRG